MGRQEAAHEGGKGEVRNQAESKGFGDARDGFHERCAMFKADSKV